MSSENNTQINLIEGIDTLANSLVDQNTPKWFLDQRKKGLSRFRELGIPTVKDEDWKYTNLSSLAKHSFKVSTEKQLLEFEPFKKYCQKDNILIVFVNGCYSNELSRTANLPDEITIAPLQKALNNTPHIEKVFSRYNTNQTTSFINLNDALNNDGTYIHINEKYKTNELIHLIHITSTQENDLASFPRTVVYLEPSSEATILESHLGFNDAIVYFADALTDIYLSENATLHYCKSQKESLRAFHIGNTRIFQEKNSNFDGFSFMAGGALTRNDLNVSIEGEGANVNLNALYSVFNDQHVDNHTLIDHRVAHCTSNQLYKGILNHSSRAVFNGKVIVNPIAQQTNSYQLNKNILLGKDCHVDTKPQLEIGADDVKCSHGAAIGQIDEDELFYLQSRCISKQDAIRILARGFVNDVIATIPHEQIRTKINILMNPSFEALK